MVTYISNLRFDSYKDNNSVAKLVKKLFNAQIIFFRFQILTKRPKIGKVAAPRTAGIDEIVKELILYTE